ncbi:MAG TPA: aminodeoxychorismate/anthranilate synthase component II, partial [Solirubrobacterales bacterium]|nr:aminodeoxychorismate/anthranilate synthase component II [Solirubrobacterales bacterium]
MKTLLVDNHDSYTYNVFHLLAAASGEEPMVVNNDAVSWRVLTRMDFDAIVLSPGPGHPSRWHDFGVCSDILRHSEIPVFGICLGHQGIGNLLEGTVNRAPMAMHGRLSRVMHEGKGLFKGVPQGFSVVRYHSLAITSPPGPEGSIVAWSDDGVVMGVEHTKRPIWGVQFHPESISTEYGLKIAENFFDLAARHKREGERPAGRATIAPRSARRAPAPQSDEGGELELRMRTIQGQAPTEHVYERLFADAETSFWLDSADAPTWLAQCSYMGTSAGAEGCFVTYDVDSGEVQVDRGGVRTVERRSIFDYLDRELRR